jgi:YgiT-type zinc finger domain-containing protein
MINHDSEDQKKYAEYLEENRPSECQACGGPLSLEKINLEDYQGGKLYLMEHVPAFVCQSCGEVWVPEPIMDEFEKMIETVQHKKEEKEKEKEKLTSQVRTVKKSHVKKHKGNKKK